MASLGSGSSGTHLVSIWSFRDLPRSQAYRRIGCCVLIASSIAIAVVCLGLAFRWIEKPFAGFLVNPRMVVGNLGLPHWTGTEAGLTPLDKILSADGAPVSSMDDLDRVAARAGIGAPVRYLIQRERGPVEIAIPTMRFSVADLILTFGIFFFLGIAYLILGIVVFLMKPDDPVSRIFLAASLVQGVSLLITFDLESTHAGFVWLTIFCDAVLPALALHLSVRFPERWLIADRRPHLKALPYVVSIIFLFLMEFSYPHPFFFKVYWWSFVYLHFSVAVFMSSAVVAYVRKTSTLARQRAKVVLLGAALAFPLPVVAPFIASFAGTFGGTKILTNLTTIPVLIFPVAVAYSISRHNLFDVDIYIKRAVGYGIVTAVVGGAYFVLQIAIDSVLAGPVFEGYATKISPILFALFVVFLFNPLNRRVQGAVDRLFYRKKTDYRATVMAVSDALSSVLNLDEIVRKIVGTVRREMFIDASGVILLSPGGAAPRGYFVGETENRGTAERGAGERTEEWKGDGAATRAEGGASEGGWIRGAAGAASLTGEPKGSGGAEGIRTVALSEGDPLVSLISGEKRLITKYDIAEDPRYASVREACGRRFGELGASMAIPLIHQNEVEGILAVGYKKSGHFYTREDVDLLTTLAGHGAVSLVNARLADQMKKDETVRTNLSRYLSPQIVDQIVKKDVQVNLGGDRKEVTVLFSDIRNFTTITEKRPPEQLVRILNEYFTEMAQVIFENQGSLDKYIGDAIVAVFGSLVPLENPAQNAVNAAIRMMKRLPELNRRWEARYGFYMNIGIGVNTGEVFLGNIGSPERMEFTVIGDAVNVASRFSGLAKPGQILVARETLSRLGDAFPHKALPPAEVKGKTGKLEVFEILYSASSAVTA